LEKLVKHFLPQQRSAAQTFLVAMDKYYFPKGSSNLYLLSPERLCEKEMADCSQVLTIKSLKIEGCMKNYP
jgi:hypothetical protein